MLGNICTFFSMCIWSIISEIMLRIPGYKTEFSCIFAPVHKQRCLPVRNYIFTYLLRKQYIPYFYVQIELPATNLVNFNWNEFNWWIESGWLFCSPQSPSLSRIYVRHLSEVQTYGYCYLFWMTALLPSHVELCYYLNPLS